MGNNNSKKFEYDDFLKLLTQSNHYEIASEQHLLQKY